MSEVLVVEQNVSCSPTLVDLLSEEDGADINFEPSRFELSVRTPQL